MKEQQEIEDGLSGPSSPDRERPDAAPPDAVRQLDANPKKDAAAEDEEGILERLKDMVFGYEDDKAIGQPVHEDGTPLAPGENPTNATVAADVAGASGKEARAKAAEEARATGESTTASGPAEGSSSKTSPGSQEGGVISTVSEQANETEESPYDHAGDAHEVDPGCQGDFMKQPAAARRHFVGFAKGRGACENRAMVPEGVNQKADFKKAKDAIANDKNISDAEEVLEEEDGTVSARPVEGGSTPSGSVEAQRRDAEESAVSAGSEEGGEEGAEEDGASSSRSRGMPKEEDSDRRLRRGGGGGQP